MPMNILEEKRRALSPREAERTLGISHATLYRLKQSPAAAEHARPDAAAAASHATTGSSREPSLAPDVAATADLRRAYTMNETRQILPVSRNKIYKLIESKDLTKIKVRGKLLITRNSIEDLLAGKDR